MDGMNQNNNPYPHSQPPKKKGTGIKIAVGVVCAFAVLIGIGIGVLAYYRSTPSYKINKGLQNLALEIAWTKNPLAEKIGMEDILLMMQEEGSHVETRLNVPLDVPMLGKTTVGVDMDFCKDVPGKELCADTSFSIMNWDVAHLNIYANDEVFCFSIPELFMEDMYIDNENVISQYNDSVWSELFSPSDMGDFSIELFPDEDERIFMNGLHKMYNIMEDFWEDFEEIRDRMAIDKVETGVYRVTFPGDVTDRLLKNLLGNYAEMYSGVEALQELKEHKDLVGSDVDLLFEIDGKNRIESIMLESPVEVLDGKISLEGELLFLGEARSIDKMQGKIGIKDTDGKRRETLGQIQMASDDTAYRVDTDLKLNEGEKTVGKMKIIVNCDAADDEFDMEVSFRNETNDMKFALEGSVDDIVKGESVEINLDQAAASVDGEEVFKATGDVAIEPLDRAVKPSADPKTALFNMTNSDLMGILFRLNGEYGGIFGSLLDNLW